MVCLPFSLPAWTHFRPKITMFGEWQFICTTHHCNVTVLLRYSVQTAIITVKVNHLRQPSRRIFINRRFRLYKCSTQIPVCLFAVIGQTLRLRASDSEQHVVNTVLYSVALRDGCLDRGSCVTKKGLLVTILSHTYAAVFNNYNVTQCVPWRNKQPGLIAWYLQTSYENIMCEGLRKIEKSASSGSFWATVETRSLAKIPKSTSSEFRKWHQVWNFGAIKCLKYETKRNQAKPLS